MPTDNPKPIFLDAQLMGQAVPMAFRKLNPLTLARNPVMFVVEVVSLLATFVVIRDVIQGGDHLAANAQITTWLWFTVLFGNFAEAIAEGRGKARADSLRATQQETSVKRLREHGRDFEVVRSSELATDDIILVEAGELIPVDGEVIEGIASVDESAITGESASVIRESGGDRSGVTGGTKVVSDWLKIRVSVRQGESFLDRMIAMVEGAERQKTPNEVALNILLVGQTIIFLVVTFTLAPFAIYSGQSVAPAYLLALLVTLIPTTIGGLLSAIGIAGMDRLVKANVIAKSGRAVEACGDVDTLLVDKTGTITFGNRMADDFKTLPGVHIRELVETAFLASLSDDTPEGKSIIELARKRFPTLSAEDMNLVNSLPFTAETRISGADFTPHCEVRKGAEDAVLDYVGVPESAELKRIISDIARTGGTPLVVAKDKRLLGVVHLKDIIKPGIRDRCQQLRKMGIRTVMLTGDNPLTAAAIAAEAGVDDFLAEATPERKLELVRRYQSEGRLVAMCGDGSNDAPALAQADVGVAMNDGTQAAKEAANLVDLDSDPTKLLDVVRVGKQLLMSRGALTTFSLANDIAKYFAILPPLFASLYPGLSALNIMELATPQSAILSAVIFNALIIVALIPLALRGVEYFPSSAEALLRRNLLIYGGGGVILPFIGIKAIDMIVVALGLA